MAGKGHAVSGLTGIARALAGRRIVVTGAGGFVGRRLMQVLQAAGVPVLALVRDRHGAARVRSSGAEPVICDLAAGRVPAQVLAGADVLIHLAYDMRASGAENLIAGAGLFTAAEEAGVGRIVHLSSVVVCDAWPEGPLDAQSSWGAAGGSGYRQAKIGLERRLMESGVPSVILEPTLVYGPGSALWTEAPLAALRQGGIVLPDPPGCAPLVHVDDVVQAVLRAAVLPTPGIGERFLITGPEAVGWAEYYGALAQVLGKGAVRLEPMDPPPPVQGMAQPSRAARVSAWGRRLIGRDRFERAVAALRSLRPVTGPVRPDAGSLRLYMARPTISIAAAQARLGYRPEVDFRTGMATIARQFRGS